ncbi:MAG: site-2 protease family protein [Nanoarchaeota archaeon]|nr:site-2 protease family protein [Nanoarchaeota archaeon]
MVGFIVYDLAFMVLFTIVVIFLLHKDRKNLKRHGWLFLYYSKFGLRFIDWTAKKFEKILKPLQYVVITSGYLLMIFIVWLISFTTYLYVTSPIPEQLRNVPPIAPLIPYFPRLFNLESIFPPLFFTYFLIALAIVAVSHEFSHGIFARLNKIKVKTTGLAFFGPFFGAFVEPDEKQMQKSKKFQQLSILAAGTFANVVMSILFVLILWWFFSISFAPAGVNFNTYPQAVINLSLITMVGNNNINEISEIPDLIEDDFNEIIADGTLFLVRGESLKKAIELKAEQIIVFDDAPAVRARLRSPILSINGEQITSPQELSREIKRNRPGDSIEIITLVDDNEIKQTIELAERDGKAYLGVGFLERNRKGFVGSLFSLIQKIRDPFVHYEPVWDNNFPQFIYDLLWWIVIINILVALFNMLPVSILDGGRFFYLTIWGITGSEKFGKKAFAFTTWVILAFLALMMIKWFISFVS